MNDEPRFAGSFPVSREGFRAIYHAARLSKRNTSRRVETYRRAWMKNAPDESTLFAEGNNLLGQLGVGRMHDAMMYAMANRLQLLADPLPFAAHRKLAQRKHGL